MFCNESYCSKLTFINEDIYNFYSERLDNIIQEGEELFKLNNRILSMNYSYLKEDSVLNEGLGGVLKKIKEFIVSIIKAIKDWLAKIFAPVINIFKKKKKDNDNALNKIKNIESSSKRESKEELDNHIKKSSPKMKQAIVKINQYVNKIKDTPKEMQKEVEEISKVSNEIKNSTKYSDEELKRKLNMYFLESNIDYWNSKLKTFDEINDMLVNGVKKILKENVISYSDLYTLNSILSISNEGNLFMFRRNIETCESKLYEINEFLEEEGDNLSQSQLSSINKFLSYINTSISLNKQLVQKLTNIYGNLNAISNADKDKLYSIVGKDPKYGEKFIKDLKKNKKVEDLTYEDKVGANIGHVMKINYEETKGSRESNPFFNYKTEE